MITALSITLFGFLLGMRHAMDADHIVAVTTIVSRERTIRHAAFVGALWGMGHTVTVVITGALILFFGIVIPRRAGLAMEFSVSLMLITLGLMNLREIVNWFNTRGRIGGAANEDREKDHDDIRLLERWFGSWRGYQAVRPFVVGVVHGLAGSATVALLVLPIIHDPQWALAYLIIFGMGTIAGMIIFTAGIALPFACAAKRSRTFNGPLRFATGFLSVGFGLFLAYQIGFVEGLFTK